MTSEQGEIAETASFLFARGFGSVDVDEGILVVVSAGLKGMIPWILDMNLDLSRVVSNLNCNLLNSGRILPEASIELDKYLIPTISSL